MTAEELIIDSLVNNADKVKRYEELFKDGYALAAHIDKYPELKKDVFSAWGVMGTWGNETSKRKDG